MWAVVVAVALAVLIEPPRVFLWSRTPLLTDSSGHGLLWSPTPLVTDSSALGQAELLDDGGCAHRFHQRLRTGKKCIMGVSRNALSSRLAQIATLTTVHTVHPEAPCQLPGPGTQCTLMYDVRVQHTRRTTQKLCFLTAHHGNDTGTALASVRPTRRKRTILKTKSRQEW